MHTQEPRKIVILNQAANYLTVGFANAFNKRFDKVVLISGSINVQGEELDEDIKWHKINQWYDSPSTKKIKSYTIALVIMWWLVMTKYRNYEVFFVSLPPMAYLLNLILPNKFSMVIWDVFPDAFKIIGMKENHIVYKSCSYLNKKSFKKAYRLFTIGEKMVELIEKYVNKDKIVQPIWSIFQNHNKIAKSENKFISKYNLENKFIVQYSGNIGLTHNIEILIEIAENLKSNDNIVFQIIGRGPKRKHLEELVLKKKLPNCMFLPFQSVDMFPFSLAAADLGVVILDEKTSKASRPSKSFNLMNYGIPSLYIASKDSQLSVDADTYNHAKLFRKKDFRTAAKWIVKLSENPEEQNKMSKNAINAAQNFKRENADKFVKKYLQP